jgi:hypothetical protein
MQASDYMARWPTVPWRTPLLVQTPDASGLACRLCIAMRGLKPTDRLLATTAEFDKHIQTEHPDVYQ